MRALIEEARFLERLGVVRTPRRTATRPRRGRMSAPSLARIKAFDFTTVCDDLKFRVKELRGVMKKVKSSMAQQLVKRLGHSTDDICKNSSHLRDILRQMDPQGKQGRYVSMGHDPTAHPGWKS